MKTFEGLLNRRDRRVLRSLDSPTRIQAFLDSIPYSADKFYRCPRRVFEDRTAHCFDGALFAAASLRRLGYPPLVLDMHASRDDDHLVALFKANGRWGAVAKSNFVGLRYREPVYRTLRELVMSYFEDFFNIKRERTLRSYTLPINLAVYDRFNWLGSDEPLEAIARRTDTVRQIPVLTSAMVRSLAPVDQWSFQAGLLGVNPAGLYRPARSRRSRH